MSGRRRSGWGRWPLLALCCVTFALGSTTTALAQSRRTPDGAADRDELSAGAQALLDADLRLGPLYVQPQMGVSFGWESVPNARDSEEPKRLVSDLAATLSPKIRLVLPFRERHEFSADAGVDYRWFQDFESLRTLNTQLFGGYSLRSHRIDLTLTDVFVDGERGFLDPLEIDGGTAALQFETDERLGIQTNEFLAVVDWKLNPRMTVTVEGGRNRIRFEEDAESSGIGLAGRLNRDENIAGAALRFALTPTIEVSPRYEWEDAVYVAPDNPREGIYDLAGVGIDLIPNSRFSAGAVVGLRRFRPDDSTVLDFSGLSLQGEASVVLGGRATLDLNGTRDITPSFWFDNTFFVRQGGGAALLVALSRRLRLGGDISYHQHDYPLETTAALLGGELLTARRNDELLNYGARGSWAFGSAGAVDVRVGWLERRSNFDFIELEGITVAVGYTIQR